MLFPADVTAGRCYSCLILYREGGSEYPLKDIRFTTIKANYLYPLLSIRRVWRIPDGWKSPG
jgi:hypothetical protein